VEDPVARRAEVVVEDPAVVAGAGAYLAEMTAVAVPEIAGRAGAEGERTFEAGEVAVAELGSAGESIRMRDPRAAGSSWQADPCLHRCSDVLKRDSVRAKNLPSTRCQTTPPARTGRRGGRAYLWLGMVGSFAVDGPGCP
jgi:hypothetical protein